MREIALRLLDKYETSEREVIHQFSGNISQDLTLLEEEVSRYRQAIEEPKKLKRQKRDMPIEMIKREEYEEWLDIFKAMNLLLSKMNYNPNAKNINRLHHRIKFALDKAGVNYE